MNTSALKYETGITIKKLYFDVVPKLSYGISYSNMGSYKETNGGLLHSVNQSSSIIQDLLMGIDFILYNDAKFKLYYGGNIGYSFVSNINTKAKILISEDTYYNDSEKHVATKGSLSGGFIYTPFKNTELSASYIYNHMQNVYNSNTVALKMTYKL